MDRVRSWLCLLGGSLGLLGHALLDVVHGEGGGLGRRSGRRGVDLCQVAPTQVKSTRAWDPNYKYADGRRADRRTRVIGCQRDSTYVSCQTINK